MKRNMKFASVLLLSASFALPALAQKPGEQIYKQKCAMCHGPDGEARTPAGKMMKAVPFKTPSVVKKSDAQLVEITKKGKGKMPEFGTKLSDTQIKQVVGYIRVLQGKK